MDSSTRGQDMLRRFSVRSSAAALRNATASERTRVIVVALAANLVVALAKLVAGVLTGSAALLAEAGHSFADSLNELLLGVSLRRGNVPADAAHPLGHGRERFLWAFMAAIASFLGGGGKSEAATVRDGELSSTASLPTPPRSRPLPGHGCGSTSTSPVSAIS